MSVSENLTLITARMRKACQEAGWPSDQVTLVAVSKVQPDDRIEAALAAGQKIFGENRVQEARQRWAARKLSNPDLLLHLIGPLQTNKVKDAVSLFDVIETIDRIPLATELAKEMARQDRHLPCFIQVNTGEEQQKSGVSPAGLAALYQECRTLGLNITGLMCIPPAGDPPALHFALLRKLAGQLGLRSLSMGMSHDYPEAIRLGATHIRVGTALFGDRQTT